jgi:hypothetical protein
MLSAIDGGCYSGARGRWVCLRVHRAALYIKPCPYATFPSLAGKITPLLPEG